MDSVTLEIFKSLYTSVAEEMGASLRRTAFSPNIKERRDYSCAVFDRRGQIIAQGDHMPVHLGSMPMSVRAAIERCELNPGDVIILNDPYAGGTHLPDVTLVAAVYEETTAHRSSVTSHRPLFYVANRAHHADIGGSTPGSMGKATEIYQEGLRIPPMHLVTRGQLNEEFLNLFLANVRVNAERKGDLTAQLGALRVGADRLREIVARYGFTECDAYARHLIDYTARMMRHTIAALPDGVYTAEDWLDDDGESDEPVRIAVTITIGGDRAKLDFTGSAPQVRGPLNAVAAITISAAYYVFRCLIPADVPASAGILDPLEIITPSGTIINAAPPAPVAGGNVETSQRIVDVLLKALSQAAPQLIPAASQGTMNNLTIGGWDATRGKEFAYYETIAGGMGARPAADGLSAVHTHMTNSLNTPVEALEYAYPLRVRRYAIRRGSGGAGKHRGGDGVIREIELLTEAQVTLLSDRRKIAPYGLAGGEAGQVGEAELISGGQTEQLKGKFSMAAKAGDRIVLKTPGGGGFRNAV
ncbi:MAG: hydantoinase B/oxoprolinase family protein [Blastocatellia bacterium]|nr:hydantoinase B/oxoprolinase family protein [Blastocatellia bacterium]